MSHPLFERHKALLDQALQAIAERGYWSAFPESPSPKVYGEGATARRIFTGGMGNVPNAVVDFRDRLEEYTAR